MARLRMRLSVRAVELRHPTKMDSSKWPPPEVYPQPCVKMSMPNTDLTTHSALTEFTPLECDIDLPRNNVEERQSRRSTSLSPCGQVCGIRQSLQEVVPSTAMKDNRDGRRDKCACNDEPHWVPASVLPSSPFKPQIPLWAKIKGGERM